MRRAAPAYIRAGSDLWRIWVRSIYDARAARMATGPMRDWGGPVALAQKIRTCVYRGLQKRVGGPSGPGTVRPEAVGATVSRVNQAMTALDAKKTEARLTALVAQGDTGYWAALAAYDKELRRVLAMTEEEKQALAAFAGRAPLARDTASKSLEEQWQGLSRDLLALAATLATAYMHEGVYWLPPAPTSHAQLRALLGALHASSDNASCDDSDDDDSAQDYDDDDYDSENDEQRMQHFYDNQVSRAEEAAFRTALHAPASHRRHPLRQQNGRQRAQ